MKIQFFLALIIFAGSLYLTNADDDAEEEPPQFVFSYPKKKTWFEAVSACRKIKNGDNSYDLADIESPDEQTEVEKMFAVKKKGKRFRTWKDQIWIAGISLTSDRSFRWLNYKTEMSFTKWEEDEPNNKESNENCIALRNRNGTTLIWNDSVCDFAYYYMCKLQPKIFTIDDIEIL